MGPQLLLFPPGTEQLAGIGVLPETFVPHPLHLLFWPGGAPRQGWVMLMTSVSTLLFAVYLDENYGVTGKDKVKDAKDAWEGSLSDEHQAVEGTQSHVK